MAKPKFRIGNTPKTKFTVKKQQPEDQQTGPHEVIHFPVSDVGRLLSDKTFQGTPNITPLPVDEKSVYFTPRSFSLKELFEEIDSAREADVANGAYQKLIRLNVQSGKASIYTPLAFWSINKQRYFIANTRSRIISPNLAYDIILPNNEQIVVNLQLEISCGLTDDSAIWMIESLNKGNAPEIELHNYITDWLHTIFNYQDQLLTSFFNNRPRISRVIVEKAEQIGLQLKVLNLQLKNERIIDTTFSISSGDYFKIQLRGLNDYLSVHYQATIACYQPHAFRAVQKFNSLKQLPTKISNYLTVRIQELDFEQVFDGIPPAIVRQLQEVVNNRLIQEQSGWQLTSLKIDLNDDDLKLPLHVAIENEPVKLPIKTQNNKAVDVQVYNTLVLNLEDPKKAKIQYNKTKRLESWSREMLQRITLNILINYTYSDLIINRETYEQQIKDELKAESKELGYTISSFIAIPDVERVKLGERFDFATDADRIYITEIGDEVKLQLIIENARIINLEGIRPYLAPETNLIGEMIRVVENATESFLLTTDPNHYYADFEKSLKAPLTEHIKHLLQKEFFVEDKIQVNARRIKTALIEKYEGLRGYHPFEVESFGNIKYNLAFSIRAIDPKSWASFKNTGFDQPEEALNTIKRHLKDRIESLLNEQLSIDYIRIKDDRFKNLFNEILTNAKEHIRSEFGLVIEITSRNRQKTRNEILWEQEQEIWLETHKKRLADQAELADNISKSKIQEYEELKQELAEAKKRRDQEKVVLIKAKMEAMEKETLYGLSFRSGLKLIEQGKSTDEVTLDRHLPAGERPQQPEEEE